MCGVYAAKDCWNQLRSRTQCAPASHMAQARWLLGTQRATNAPSARWFEVPVFASSQKCPSLLTEKAHGGRPGPTA